MMKPPGSKSYINLHIKLLKTCVTYMYVNNINKNREKIEKWKANGQMM